MHLFRKALSEEGRQARVKNRRVHMANERTFLAWIRTSIGIMAFSSSSPDMGISFCFLQSWWNCVECNPKYRKEILL